MRTESADLVLAKQLLKDRVKALGFQFHRAAPARMVLWWESG